jgi:hypothetical protein
MWTQVGADDQAGLQRHVAIMQQMDRGYGKLTERDLIRSIIEQKGELWIYRGDGFEIGLHFQYSWERHKWQLAQVGFTGRIEPSAVLDLNVAQGRLFFERHRIDAVFCGPPLRVDYAPLQAYYTECKKHSQLRVEVIYKTDIKEIWEIRYVAA